MTSCLFSGVTKDEIGPLRTIVSGGIAGMTLWTLIFPADVIKSRQQVGVVGLGLAVFKVLKSACYATV